MDTTQKANTTQAFDEKLAEIGWAIKESGLVGLEYHRAELPFNCTVCTITQSTYDDNKWWRATVQLSRAHEVEAAFSASVEYTSVYSRKLAKVENKVFTDAKQLIEMVVTVAQAIL